MVSIDKEEWRELIKLLKSVEQQMAKLVDGADLDEVVDSATDSLKTFHSTAAMLGFPGLETVGKRLEEFLHQYVKEAGYGESSSTFNFALNALIDEMRHMMKQEDFKDVEPEEIVAMLDAFVEVQDSHGESPGLGGGKQETPVQDENEVIDTLVGAKAVESMGGDKAFGSEGSDDEKPSGEEKETDFANLEALVGKLGGNLTIHNNGDGSRKLELWFPAESSVMQRLEAMFSSSTSLDSLQVQLDEENDRLGEVLEDVKEFMSCMTEGDLEKAQKVLLELAEAPQRGLYQEIGALARDLHNSLKEFAGTMDPILKEMVEDRLPDSGNRLEHIMHLTERAATTTLDHVEKMQKRNEEEQKQLEKISEIASGLHPVGEKAAGKLDEIREAIHALIDSVKKNHDDLLTVLTAQDYQDLTGQIIMKIINLLHDLEGKLLNLITTFGVKLEKDEAAKVSDELYGPAHEAKEGSLHSQDDVDALLAEFGF